MLINKQKHVEEIFLLLFTDFAPGAPPFNDSLDVDVDLDIPVNIGSAGVVPSGGGRPTLKDYLDMMKANKMPIPGKTSEG